MNQNDYPGIPYPAKGYEKATVKSSGCGPVAIAMVVENLTGKRCPVEDAVNLAKACGARVPGGTDMQVLSRAACEKYGMSMKASQSIDEAVTALQDGAVVIALVGGDNLNTGYKGVFSTGGHYIVLAGVVGDRLLILDPGLYSGKYGKPHRKAVEVAGNLLYATPEVVARDCQSKSPRYFIYTK